MKVKRNIKKAIGIIAAALIIIFLAEGIAYICIYDISSFYRIEFYENYDYTAMELLDDYRIYALSDVELTRADMKEDMDYFFELMETCQPNIPFYEQLYGFDMGDLRSACTAGLDNIDTEEEFYGYISAVINMLPSCHSSVIPPDFNNFQYCSTSYLNYASTMSDSELIGYTNSWKEILLKYYEEQAYSSDVIGAQYIDGRYYIASVSDRLTEYIDWEISSINGGVPEKYISENITCQKLKYDFINENIYCDGLFFYDQPSETSTKISIKLLSPDGEQTEFDAYSDCIRDVITAYYLAHSKSSEMQNASYAVSEAYSYDDDSRDITYITLPMITSRSAEIHDMIKNIKNENVIVDLRYCPGGEVSFTVNEIYPALFSCDTTLEYTIYRPFSKLSRRFCDSYGIKDLAGDIFAAKEYNELFPDSNLKYTAEKRTLTFSGNKGSDKNVYILIGGSTASSADLLASATKSTGSAVLIGSNTNGEGIISGVYLDKLPNSKLMFTYVKECSVNSAGKSNSVYGTSPDIYSANTLSERYNFIEISEKGENPYIYENRLEWDSVLIKAIEIIEENGG